MAGFMSLLSGGKARGLKRQYKKGLQELNHARNESNVGLRKARNLGGGYAKEVAMQGRRKVTNMAGDVRGQRDAWQKARKHTRMARGATTLGLGATGVAGYRHSQGKPILRSQGAGPMKTGERLFKLAFYSQETYAYGPHMKMTKDRRQDFKDRANRRAPVWVGSGGALGAFFGWGLSGGKGRGTALGGAIGAALGGGASAIEHESVKNAKSYRGMSMASYDFDGKRAKARLKDIYKKHYASIKDPELRTDLRGMSVGNATKSEIEKSQGKVKLRKVHSVYM